MPKPPREENPREHSPKRGPLTIAVREERKESFFCVCVCSEMHPEEDSVYWKILPFSGRAKQ